MQKVMGARTELRRATADLHDRVDGVFAGAELGSRQGYTRFLVAQAAAHLAVEDALDAADAAAFVADWPARRRANLLLDDLKRLGEAAPAPLGYAGPRTKPAVIGAVYVLEGSRLGGALLRRAVAPGLPIAFLSAQDPGAWRRLLQVIDADLESDDEIGEAIAAARSVFATFERAGRHYLKVT